MGRGINRQTENLHPSPLDKDIGVLSEAEWGLLPYIKRPMLPGIAQEMSESGNHQNARRATCQLRPCPPRVVIVGAGYLRCVSFPSSATVRASRPLRRRALRMVRRPGTGIWAIGRP